MPTAREFYFMKQLPARALQVLAGKIIGDKQADMIHLSLYEIPVKKKFLYQEKVKI